MRESAWPQVVGRHRRAADAGLAAFVAAIQAALQIAIRKTVRLAESFFGTILPRATAHRRATDLAA